MTIRPINIEGQPAQEWLQSMGVSLPDYLGPRNRYPRIRILLLPIGSLTDTVRTIASLLVSTVQDFEVLVDGAATCREDELRSWLEGDDRFVVVPSVSYEHNRSAATMILPAGIILTPYTIEALFEAARDPAVKVVRVAVSRCARGLEFWKSDFLSAHSLRNAENAARKSGGERWINGEALGVHAATEPPPKVFFRRGRADKHIVDVVVYQSRSEMPVRQPNEELVALRKEVARLRKLLQSRVPGPAKRSVLTLYSVGYSLLRRIRVR